MADLRDLFAEAGAPDALTYLQTGNVVFRSEDGASVAARVEGALGRAGVQTRAILRRRADLATSVAANPFAATSDDPTSVYIVFLALKPDPLAISRLEVPAGESAVLALLGQDAFVHAPAGYSRTKLTSMWLEHRLGVPATARNLRVAREVLALMDHLASRTGGD